MMKWINPGDNNVTKKNDYRKKHVKSHFESDFDKNQYSDSTQDGVTMPIDDPEPVNFIEDFEKKWEGNLKQNNQPINSKDDLLAKLKKRINFPMKKFRK